MTTTLPAIAAAVAAARPVIGALGTALPVGTVLAETPALAVMVAVMLPGFAAVRTGVVLYFFGSGTCARRFTRSKFSAFFGKLIHLFT